MFTSIIKELSRTKIAESNETYQNLAWADDEYDISNTAF